MNESSAPVQELSDDTETSPSQSDWRKEEGRTVFLIVKKTVCTAVITEADNGFIGLKYSHEGKERFKWVRPKKIYKTIGEAQTALGSQGE